MVARNRKTFNVFLIGKCIHGIFFVLLLLKYPDIPEIIDVHF